MPDDDADNASPWSQYVAALSDDDADAREEFFGTWLRYRDVLFGPARLMLA